MSQEISALSLNVTANSYHIEQSVFVPSLDNLLELHRHVLSDVNAIATAIDQGTAVPEGPLADYLTGMRSRRRERYTDVVEATRAVTAEGLAVALTKIEATMTVALEEGGLFIRGTFIPGSQLKAVLGEQAYTELIEEPIEGSVEESDEEAIKEPFKILTVELLRLMAPGDINFPMKVSSAEKVLVFGRNFSERVAISAQRDNTPAMWLVRAASDAERAAEGYIPFLEKRLPDTWQTRLGVFASGVLREEGINAGDALSVNGELVACMALAAAYEGTFNGSFENYRGVVQNLTATSRTKEEGLIPNPVFTPKSTS